MAVIMDDSLLLLVINVHKHFLVTQEAQLDGLLDYAFSSFDIGDVPGIIVVNMIHI
jgi:hypothetical protein